MNFFNFFRQVRSQSKNPNNDQLYNYNLFFTQLKAPNRSIFSQLFLKKQIFCCEKCQDLFLKNQNNFASDLSFLNNNNQIMQEKKLLNNKQDNQFKKQAQEQINKCLQVSKLIPENKWEFYGENKEQNSLHFQPITEYYNSRLQGVINASLEDTKDIIISLQAKKYYDDFFLQGKIIREINPDLSLIYLKYKGIFPLANRDMVVMCTAKKLKDGRMVVAAQSIQHKDYPDKNDSTVRADLKMGSWILESKDKQKTKAIFVQCINPMVYVPSFVFKYMALDQLRLFDNINQYIIQFNIGQQN